MGWRFLTTVGENRPETEDLVDVIMESDKGDRLTLTHRDFYPEFERYSDLGLVLIPLVLHDLRGRDKYEVNDQQLRSALTTLSVEQEDPIWPPPGK
jgi:hypothetical protein